MNFDTLSHIIENEYNLPQYHLQALMALINRGGSMSYRQISSWPKDLSQNLESKSPFNSFVTASLIKGKDNSKALLTLKDNISIETVFIKTKSDHYSICLSSQSGCAMGCAFCATGTLGLIRSLTAEEIADQFLYWRQTFPDVKPQSVVFMGMGEPMANQPEVFKSIQWLNQYYGLGYRHMTVSTCGLPSGIEAIAKTYPQVNLAISLHAASQSLRLQIMPIAKKIDLTALTAAITTYFSLTNRQLTLEYLLLSNVNDTPSALDDLIQWTKQFPKHLIHINLINYNQTTTQFTSPSTTRINQVIDYLKSHHLSVTLRKSQGQDIYGACGQLALKT